MAGSFNESISAAWAALWESGNRYEIAPRIKRGGHLGQTWFWPVGALAIADTGPIVLKNSGQWGIVSINLKDNLLEGALTIAPDSFEYHAGTGKISAKIHFDELTFSGDYVITRGEATSSGFKAAMATLSMSAATGDDGISNAKAYQAKLTTTPNGQAMLNQYYLHNDTYADAITNTHFGHLWATDQTNGQTTSHYAAQTNTAANSPDSVAINDKYYNTHSFSQQLYLVTACNHMGHQKGTAAANAAADFKTNVSANNPQGQANDRVGQNVNDVMTTVSTGTAIPSTTKNLDTTAMSLSATPKLPEDDFSWAPEEIREETRKRVLDGCVKIAKHAEDVRRGVINLEDTKSPIPGQYISRFKTLPMTLIGTANESGPGGHPIIEFTSLEGDILDFEILLGAFPGKLHPEVQQALNNARFVNSVLGTRFVQALNASPLRADLGNMMMAALSGEG